MAMNSITEGFCLWRCPIRNNLGIGLYERMHHFVEIRTFGDRHGFSARDGFSSRDAFPFWGGFSAGDGFPSEDGFTTGERINHWGWHRINPNQFETNRNES